MLCNYCNTQVQTESMMKTHHYQYHSKEILITFADQTQQKITRSLQSGAFQCPRCETEIQLSNSMKRHSQAYCKKKKPKTFCPHTTHRTSNRNSSSTGVAIQR